jgi:hypothetical protein
MRGIKQLFVDFHVNFFERNHAETIPNPRISGEIRVFRGEEADLHQPVRSISCKK